MKLRGSIISGALVALAATHAAPADAAGLFTTDRGVRPLGRGGAFVAGADDLGAIWYNPAGLADAGTSVLIDFSSVNFSSNYTRSSLVTDSGGVVRTVNFPQVQGTSQFLPIPTIAASYNFGRKKEFTIAGGIFAPYTAIASYPLTVNGQPAPSRYSLVSLQGSALVITGAYFAYKPIEQIRLGIGLEALVGNFASSVVFSASPPDRLIGAPEDPQYDAFSQLTAGPIVAPSGNFGIIGIPNKHLHLGLSGNLPFYINAPATVQVRLPTAAVFDKATQVGDSARVRMTLPAIARAGIEYRVQPGGDTELRVELAYVREFWSMFKSIDIRPEDITLHDITGFPSPFGVAPISLPKNFQDSNSVRLGGEYSSKNFFQGYGVDLRAGVQYETSAIPEAWVSPQTFDSNKVIASAGGSLHVGAHWRMDAVAALAFYSGTNVSPAEAQVPRVNPVQGNPTATEAINGGVYSAKTVVLGVGVNYKF